MIKRDYERIVDIMCDFCFDDFTPEFECGDDATEISIAWEQAEACGWTARWDADANGWLHCCLACAREVAA